MLVSWSNDSLQVLTLDSHRQLIPTADIPCSVVRCPAEDLTGLHTVKGDTSYQPAYRPLVKGKVVGYWFQIFGAGDTIMPIYSHYYASAADRDESLLRYKDAIRRLKEGK